MSWAAAAHDVYRHWHGFAAPMAGEEFTRKEAKHGAKIDLTFVREAPPACPIASGSRMQRRGPIFGSQYAIVQILNGVERRTESCMARTHGTSRRSGLALY